MIVEKIMETDVKTVTKEEHVHEVLEYMKDHKINGAPVVDERGHLLGIVVKADIYRFLIAPGHYESCPVEWVMSKTVVTAYPDEDIKDVAKRITENGITSIPVIERESSKVVGIVSLEDFVRMCSTMHIEIEE